jgi:DNA-binding SARP family transcriptional activator
MTLEARLRLELRILGPLELVRDGSSVALGGPLERAVLALLALRSGATVSRERLISDLWGDDPPVTAVSVLQTYVSHLRRALPEERLVTRAPGYALRLEPGELDLHAFEELALEGRDALASGDAATAADRLRQALALWRGPALADVVKAEFGRIEAARLEELRLAALEERLQADLALGRHAEIVAEIEALVVEHPLRERLRSQHMLALYRCGRQSEALAAYRDARKTLVDELGIEPGRALRELESAILRQDPSLDPQEEPPAIRAHARSLVVVCVDEGSLDPLLALAEPLARHPRHDLVLVRLVPEAASLAGASRAVSERRAELVRREVPARAVAFTSGEPALEVVRLGKSQDVSLLLLDSAGGVDPDGRFRPWLARILAETACDVAVLANDAPAAAPAAAGAVAVPFGGADHEWAAAEVAAWIAAAEGRPLELIGAAADRGGERRDASRLLGSVALLLQQVAAIETRPSLIPAGADAVVAAVAGARAIVVGLPNDWTTRGLGRTRATLVRHAGVPVLLVRGGVRPGGLAPDASLTRFTWTLTHGA